MDASRAEHLGEGLGAEAAPLGRKPSASLEAEAALGYDEVDEVPRLRSFVEGKHLPTASSSLSVSARRRAAVC